MSMAQQFTQVRENVLRPADVYAEETGEYAALRVDRAPAGVPIVVLTTDVELGNTIRKWAAGEHEVAVTQDLASASELANAGKCAILITDQALTQSAASNITEQLRPIDPAVVTIVVGSRGEDNVLLSLMSSEAIDRFMLKPLTAGLAKIVLDSADREYGARKARLRPRRAAAEAQSRARAEPVAPAPPVEVPPASAAPPKKEVFRGNNEVTQGVRVEPAPALAESAAADVPPPSRSISRPSWIVFLAAVAAVGALVWWVMFQRLPDIDPRELVASNLSSADAALTQGRYLEPAEQSALHYFGTVLALDPANTQAKQGIDRIADHFAAASKSLIDQNRFAEAVSALQSVRRVRPQHAQLVALETELRTRLEQRFPQVRVPAVETSQAVRTEVAKLPRKSGEATGSSVAKPQNPAPRVEPRLDTAATQSRMLADAKQAIEQGRLDLAGQLISAAREVGVSEVDLLALNQTLVAAQQEREPANAQQLSAQRAVEDRPQEASLPPSGRAAAPEIEPATLAARSAPVTAPAPASTTPATPAAGSAAAHPVLIKVVQPDFPGEARLRGIEGWVDLSFIVSAGGDVVEPRVEDSNMRHLFARPALNAVRQWRYQPRADAGPNLERTRVRVLFQLNQR